MHHLRVGIFPRGSAAMGRSLSISSTAAIVYYSVSSFLYRKRFLGSPRLLCHVSSQFLIHSLIPPPGMARHPANVCHVSSELNDVCLDSAAPDNVLSSAKSNGDTRRLSVDCHSLVLVWQKRITLFWKRALTFLRTYRGWNISWLSAFETFSPGERGVT